MKKLLKMMKKGDIIIISLLVILSFLPLLLVNQQEKRIETATEPIAYALVTVDGEELYRMELLEDGQSETYQYESEAGPMNRIKRTGTKVYMADANCSDALCVQQGEISKDGEVIICLPHRLLVEVVREGDKDEDTEVDLIPQ